MRLQLEERLIEWICSIPPEKRRRWAIRLVILTIPFEVLTHILMEILPIYFFQHVLMVVSFFAIYMTGFDYVATTDVKVDTAETEIPSPGVEDLNPSVPTSNP